VGRGQRKSEDEARRYTRRDDNFARLQGSVVNAEDVAPAEAQRCGIRFPRFPNLFNTSPRPAPYSRRLIDILQPAYVYFGSN